MPGWILRNLRDFDLELSPVPGDGSCALYAVAVSSKLLPSFACLDSPYPRNTDVIRVVEELRTGVKAFMRVNDVLYKNEPELWTRKGTTKVYDRDAVDASCAIGAWFGPAQLRALASVVDKTIIAFNVEGDSTDTMFRSACVYIPTSDQCVDLLYDFADVVALMDNPNTICIAFSQRPGHFTALVRPGPKRSEKARKHVEAENMQAHLLDRFTDPKMTNENLFTLPVGAVPPGTRFDGAGLRVRYKFLALHLHPDKNVDKERATTAFQRLQAAYDELLAALKTDKRRKVRAIWQPRALPCALCCIMRLQSDTHPFRLGCVARHLQRAADEDMPGGSSRKRRGDEVRSEARCLPRAPAPQDSAFYSLWTQKTQWCFARALRTAVLLLQDAAPPPKPPRKPRNPAPGHSDPALAAKIVEETCGADPSEPRDTYNVTITMASRKSRGNQHPELTEAVRARMARHFVDTASAAMLDLDANGNSSLFSFSVERGTNYRYQQAHHVQGFATFHIRGGKVTAQLFIHTFCMASSLNEPGVDVHCYIRFMDETEDIGEQFEYTMKQRGKKHFYHKHGGSAYRDEDAERWRRDYEEKHSSMNSTGFKKRAFSATSNGGDRMKVHAMNMVTLAIQFAQRERLEFLGASIIRRMAWMLQTGSYEIEQSVVSGRYGSTTSRLRLEALAVLNEAPQARAGDLALVQLVCCGTGWDQSPLELGDVRYRAPFLLAAQNVETLDLFDAQYVRDHNCELPVRMSLLLPTWAMEARGCAVVIDLGFGAELQHSRDTLGMLHVRRLDVCNRLYEHCAAEDANGFLSVGYVQCVLDHLLRDRTRKTFDGLSLYHAMTYNTPLFYNAVERALQGYAPEDRSVLALAQSLGVLVQAAQLNGVFHGVVNFDALSALVDNTLNGNAPVHVAVVRAIRMNGASHHYAVAWVVAPASVGVPRCALPR